MKTWEVTYRKSKSSLFLNVTEATINYRAHGSASACTRRHQTAIDAVQGVRRTRHEYDCSSGYRIDLMIVLLCYLLKLSLSAGETLT